jgi:hypothetical protein
MYFRITDITKLLLLYTTVTFIGCDESGYPCSAVTVPAIKLTVKNSAGEYVCDQVTAVVFEDSYRDTLAVASVNELGEVISLQGAYERAGNYSLIITSDVYNTYTDTQIIVRDGQCHVKTEELSVVVENK